MQRHILKTDPEVFQAKMEGRKPYELRFDDRAFQVGDDLLLVETKFTGAAMAEGSPLEYTGRYMLVRITHKLKDVYGLQPGWCVLADRYLMSGLSSEPESFIKTAEKRGAI